MHETTIAELEPIGPGCDINRGCSGLCIGGLDIDIDIKIPKISLPW